MSLKPQEDIGSEVHEELDQFIRIEEGKGKAVLNGKEYDIEEGSAVVIPGGTEHNIINTSEDEPMKLYTVYSPPEHKDGVVHETKEEAEADHEEFDGNTTE
jgi:mannose-6-phosphate isomerase-like protein (cupin superfamily)